MEQQIMKAMDRVGKALDIVIAVALGLMVVMVFSNVVLRYAFNSGITVSEELSRWLFVWMTFMGALVALKDNGHLGTDMLISRLPVWGKRLCLGASQLLMLGVTVLLLQGSWAQSKINWDVEAPVTGAPMAVVYASGVVFGLLAIFVLLFDLFRTFTGRVRDDELVMIQESEDQVHTSAGEGSAK
jgi:TRAP-type transport system small permease protein